MAFQGCSDNVSTDYLKEGFANPPQQSRPQVWWHWIDGNITKDGIKKDLEWMKRIGIGGFHHFDVSAMSTQLVDNRLVYMHDDWKDAFQYAVRLADSLDLEMTIASSPGWSHSGGPWVEPEDGMKKIVWRQTRVHGNQSIDMPLPEPFTATGSFQNQSGGENPTECYGDIATVAVKLADDYRDISELGVKVSSSNGPVSSVDVLTDNDFTTGVSLSGESWIQYSFDTPQTFCALSVGSAGSGGAIASMLGSAAPEMVLQTKDESNRWCDAVTIPSSPSSSQTISFAPVTSRDFRLKVKAQNGGEFAMLAAMFGMNMPSASETFIPEFNLYNTNRINHVEAKAGYVIDPNASRYVTAEGASVQEVIDITSKVSDGRIKWDVPQGEWAIYRFGWSLTGKQNSPAPAEATGLEVDKMDPGAWSRYFHNYFDMYKQASAGLMGKKGITAILTDSYEAGIENWSPTLPEEFKKRCGYDLINWLPVITGEVIGSTAQSEKFLFDFRTTQGEMIAKNYDLLSDIAAEYGIMTRYSESHESGRVYLVDGMDVKRTATIPTSAIWTPSTEDIDSELTMRVADLRESSSVSHIYGQNLAAAESFTSSGLGGNAYACGPADLKKVADLEFASGINRIIIHETAHQPLDDKVPGLGLMVNGQWFNRHETWAEYAKPWIDYLSRSSFMLQQGRQQADILCYYGEDGNVTSIYNQEAFAVPDGYNYDFINPTALLDAIDVKDGRLVTRSGMSYSVLVLDRNCEIMSEKISQRIEQLRSKGAVIVSDHEALVEALKSVPADYISDSKVRVVHRDLGKKQIWWVANPLRQEKRIHISFNVSGLKPQVWDPMDGSIRDVEYTISDSRTEVILDMDPEDALFVVFDAKADKQSTVLPRQETISSSMITSPWKVSFQENRGAPKSIEMESLSSLSESDIDGVRYFSGTASYSNCFEVNEIPESLTLSLGEVSNIAEVFINGKSAGILWKQPYEVDITSLVHEGKNDLKVDVTNLWVNRLVGDAKSSPSDRITYTSFAFYNEYSSLIPSGLIGPVSLVSKENVLPPLTQASTALGLVKGVEKDKSGFFYGIPYAEPPVGDLRWKAPVPSKGWDGVLDCTSVREVAPQVQNPQYGASVWPMSEDCLYLNVVTPAKSAEEKLPVLVWIHGGAFKTGSANESSTERFAKEGIVCVSIAYRLGALGFLAHPDLTSESGYSGNYGILDMIEALKWVQNNISSFGGDPTKVTIAGQSAGAMAVNVLCSSTLSSGLFARAISQSGGFYGPSGEDRLADGSVCDLSSAERQGLAFASRMGASDLKTLREMPYEAFLSDSLSNADLYGFWAIRDGHVLSENPSEDITGNISILVGTNSDDGGMFVGKTTVGEYKKFVKETFKDSSDDILSAYKASTDEESSFAMADICRDVTFAYPTWHWATRQAEVENSGVYLYYFDQPLVLPFIQTSTRGANHVTESLHLLGTLTEMLGISDPVGPQMYRYWANFIKTGNPNEEGLIYWPQFDNNTESVMHFLNGCSLIGTPNLQQLNALKKYYESKQ